MVTRDIVEQRTKAIQAFIAEQSSAVVEIQKRLRREVATLSKHNISRALEAANTFIQVFFILSTSTNTELLAHSLYFFGFLGLFSDFWYNS